MPQPLKALANGAYEIEWDAAKAFDLYPDLGLLVAKCNATWAGVERGVNNFVINSLGANSRVAIKMLESLTSTAAQTAAIGAVAEVVLPPENPDRKFYNAAMSVFKTQAKQRNKLVHHIWGVEKRSTPNCLILTDPSYMTNWIWNLKYSEMPQPLSGEESVERWLKTKTLAPDSTYVYGRSDLERILRDFQETGEILHLLSLLVEDNSASWQPSKETIRNQLLEKPLMQQPLRK